MKYTTLPSTAIKVSKICLGTMTWGNQNTEAEGHAQMDFALDHGVNFFDTAELYPVPATPDRYANTEKIIEVGTGQFNSSGRTWGVLYNIEKMYDNISYIYDNHYKDYIKD